MSGSYGVRRRNDKKDIQISECLFLFPLNATTSSKIPIILFFFQSAIVFLIFFQFLYLFLAYFRIDFFHIFFLYSFLHQIIFYIHFEPTFATFAYYFYNIRLFFLYPFLDANNFLLVLAVFFLFNNKCCYYSSSLYRKE